MMKHYLRNDGSLWAFDSDGSQDDLISGDMAPLTDEQLAHHRAEQHQQTMQNRIASYIMAVQEMLDEAARGRGYDGILSACTYAASTVERFRKEGLACIAWRDAVWAECYRLLDEVKAGQRQPPQMAVLLSSLPVIEWPTAAP